MQFGTNHLGHFALTGWLLPALLATPQARVVTVSSMMHLRSGMAFDNLDGAKRYNSRQAYAQSKLANLLFAYELQRRFANAGADILSVGCHPGYAATNLQIAGPRLRGSRVAETMSGWANRLFAQSAAMGALPTLYAATAPDVAGGDYIGPLGLGKMRGYPGKVRSSARSYDVATAQRLWQVSTQLTGVPYTGLTKAVASR
jgi:NAD(P)-dependent dehydrogenase (short-subunit alcohol dehydrogenase family)